MATHSSVLAWRIPGTEEPGGLPSMGPHRVGHDRSDLAAAGAHCGQSLGKFNFLQSHLNWPPVLQTRKQPSWWWRWCRSEHRACAQPQGSHWHRGASRTWAAGTQWTADLLEAGEGEGWPHPGQRGGGGRWGADPEALLVWEHQSGKAGVLVSVWASAHRGCWGLWRNVENLGGRACVWFPIPLFFAMSISLLFCRFQTETCGNRCSSQTLISRVEDTAQLSCLNVQGSVLYTVHRNGGLGI